MPHRLKRLLLSFVHAGRGVVESHRCGLNARIQLAAAGCAIAMSVALRISAAEWALVLLACASVIALECANTGVEALVDLTCPHRHDMARRAKDCAAGAVLVASIGAVAVGCCVFVPRLWQMIRG